MRRSDKDLKLLGNHIKEIRKKLNMRQDEIEMFGVSYKHYQDIEGGKTNPTYLTLLKLAEALKCEILDLVPRNG